MREILKLSFKLLLISWAVSVFPVGYGAFRRGQVDVYVIVEALGFALLPSIIGVMFLIGLRKELDRGWKTALIASLIIIGLASAGLFLRN